MASLPNLPTVRLRERRRSLLARFFRSHFLKHILLEWQWTFPVAWQDLVLPSNSWSTEHVRRLLVEHRMQPDQSTRTWSPVTSIDPRRHFAQRHNSGVVAYFYIYFLASFGLAQFDCIEPAWNLVLLIPTDPQEVSARERGQTQVSASKRARETLRAPVWTRDNHTRSTINLIYRGEAFSKRGYGIISTQAMFVLVFLRDN